jgi:hypothetical protein
MQETLIVDPEAMPGGPASQSKSGRGATKLKRK